MYLLWTVGRNNKEGFKKSQTLLVATTQCNIVSSAFSSRYPMMVLHSSQVSIFSLSCFQVSLTIPFVTLLLPYNFAVGYFALS